MKFCWMITLLLISMNIYGKEPKCDIFIGMGMLINQKIDENTYVAVGMPAGYGQVFRVEYKNLGYSRLVIKTLKNNSYMKSSDYFKYNNRVFGWFNFQGAKKIKLEDGFDADVLELNECPDAFKMTEKVKKDQENEEAKRLAEEEKQNLEYQKQKEMKEKEDQKKRSQFNELFK